MNSKIILLLIFIPILNSCGVKGPPVAPKGTEITPWENTFLGADTKDDESKKKNKK